jgi:hypothetical protein
VTSTVDIDSRLLPRLTERLVGRFLARQSDGLLAALADRLENPHA